LGNLIDGEKLREKLEQSISVCDKKLVFISAYVTQTAVDWLGKHVPIEADVHLVCRLQPSDVMNGATHLSALTEALDRGWSVSCLHSLHAKIYAIDDKEIYVGSANLTSNGLKIYGSGNLEACSSVPANEENVDFIAMVERLSNPLDKEMLKKMEDSITNKVPVIHWNQWPEDILPQDEGLWVHDFFWSNPNSDNHDEQSHDLDLIGIESFDVQNNEVSELLLRTRCIQWLILQLKDQPEQELYFGKLTQLLHESLQDDPSPYRKDVKSLVQNLLAYCQVFLKGRFEITRPNYSQRVRLSKE